MTIAVVSDSHGNLEGIRQAVRELVSAFSVDLFIHLGDEYDDAEVLDEFGRDYLRVPGVFSEHYADPGIPNRLLRRFDGWRFLITHTDASHPNDLQEDLRPEDIIARGEADVVLSGHTHVPSLSAKGGVLLVNPGHLKKEDKKGHTPTFAVIDVGEKAIRARIVMLGSGEILQDKTLRKT